MSDLSVNTENVRLLSTDLTKSKNEYDLDVVEIYKTIDDISSKWEGADSEGYITTANSYKKDINDLGEVLGDYADFLSRNVADRYDEAFTDVKNIVNRM